MFVVLFYLSSLQITASLDSITISLMVFDLLASYLFLIDRLDIT